MNVSVIGLGKLGLPLLALLAKSNHAVSGYDKSIELRAKLNSQNHNFHEPGLNGLLTENSANIRIVDSVGEALKKSSVVFVIVPTPTDETLKFSNEYVIEVINEFSKALETRNEY